MDQKTTGRSAYIVALLAFTAGMLLHCKSSERTSAAANGKQMTISGLEADHNLQSPIPANANRPSVWIAANENFQLSNGNRIVRSDSTYYIEFYDSLGYVTGRYDIWENNPFNLPFEKYNPTPGHFPMRYKVPDLRRNQMLASLPGEITKSLDADISIGRLDIYPVLPYSLERYVEYIPVLYQINAMRGYEEEYEIPASMGIIHILDKQGAILKSVRVDQAVGLSPAVSQDGKYLVYIYGHKGGSFGACFDVYDLLDDKVVYTYCEDKVHEIHGAFLHNTRLLGIGVVHPLRLNTFISFVLDSNKELLYMKKFGFDRTSTNFTIGMNGVIVQELDDTTPDTIFYLESFDIIPLEK